MDENIVWYVKYAEIINIIRLISSFVTIGTAIIAFFIKKELKETKNELTEIKNTLNNSGNINNKGKNNGTQIGGGSTFNGGNTFGSR